MKKKTTLCLALSVVLLLLFAGGCNRTDNKEPNTGGNGTPGNNETENGNNNTPGDTNTPGGNGSTAEDHMGTLRGLIGKADDELVKAFGEGEAVVENAITTGRRYTMNILGEEMPVHVALDEQGNIVSADAELPDVDEERWNKALTDEFGEPKTPEGADAADSRPQWIKDGTIYAIEKANDKLALRIMGEKKAG